MNNYVVYPHISSNEWVIPKFLILNDQAKKAVIRVVVPLLLLPGSGGAITARGVAQQKQLMHSPNISIDPHHVLMPVYERSPAVIIESIRTVYGLNMSELASVLGVTRPTAYSWLRGKDPKPESMENIYRLASVVDEIKNLRVPKVQSLLRRPIFEGRSIIDKIKSNEDIGDALITIKTIAYKEAQTRKRQKGFGDKISPFDDAASNISTPTYSRS